MKKVFLARRLSLGKLYPLVVAALLLIIGCASMEPTPSPGQLTPTPDVQATIAALAQANNAEPPIPTPVPPQVRQAVVEFASGHRRVLQDWEVVNSDLDEWRQGLIECDASAVRVALGQFAGRFSDITQSARELPRPPMLRDLADQLIAVTEQEEATLRLLWETWQPGEAGPSRQVATGPGGQPSPTPGAETSDAELPENPQQASQRMTFRQVEAVRSEVSELRKRVDDRLRDLQESTTPAARELIDDFSIALASLNSAWDQFHQNYDAFRSQGLSLTPSQELAELGELIEEFRGITIAVRQLPVSNATRPVYESLADAAEAEDLALRRVRSALQGLGPASTQGPRVPPPPTAAPNSSGGGSQPGGAISGVWRAILTAQGGSNQAPGNLSAFDAFDAQLVKSNAVRRQAQQELDSILEAGSNSGRRTLEGFMAQYEEFRQELDTFYQDYDNWRRTEGGCARREVIDALGQFTIRFGELASRVRALPSGPSLQPMAETLVEAVEREEQALRALRNTWRPFDASIYQTLNQERSRARRLLRQVDVGVQELLERYRISPQELEE